MDQTNLLDIFRNVLKKYSLGVAVFDEQFVEIIVGHILRKNEQKITVFFPEYTGLKPFTVHGIPPREGEDFYVHAMFSRSPQEDQNYDDWFGWKVKKVTYSVTVNNDLKSTLRMTLQGHATNPYNIEIHLHKGRRWRDAYPLKKEKS